MNESEQKLVGWLNASFFRLVSHFPDDFYPETLYHYTSAAGLHGIISSGKLWGANYSYLNDSSELVYGRELATKVVLERLEVEGDQHVKSFLKGIYDTLTTTAEAVDFYLTCFCKTPDLLSQWRGYGTASGRFCIGFDTEQLYESKTKILDHLSGPCVYREDRQRHKVGRAIDEACSTLMKGRAYDEAFRTAISSMLIEKLLKEICFFKDPGFEEEDEWRMVHFAPDASSVHFQTSAGLLKPFVDMITASTVPAVLPIAEIMVGKSRIGPLARKSVELLLARYNYRDVEVRDSAVPFRDI